MVSSMGDILFRKIIYINQEVTKMNEYARLIMVFFIFGLQGDIFVAPLYLKLLENGFVSETKKMSG